jgi:ketosteroid isomerase-like protein
MADSPHHDPASVHRCLVDSYASVLAGDLEGPLALIAPDVVDHRGGLGGGDFRGIDAWRTKWELAGSASSPFTNVSVTVEANVANDEYSVNRYTSRGTDPTSGRGYEITSIDMVRVRDGQVIEHWALRDQAALEQQLSGEDTDPTAPS